MLKKGDFILVVFLLLVSIASLYSVVNQKSSNGGVLTAEITHAGRLVQRIELDKVDKPFKVNIDDRYDNIILVEKDRIRFEAANCPDKQCIKTGWLTYKGDTSVCLPNRTIVKIINTSKVDGLTY